MSARSDAKETTSRGGLSDVSEYLALTIETLATRLGALPAMRDRVGPDSRQWTVEEVGDGNLNLVFIVRGPVGAAVLKQALPYVRLVGDSWPLPLSRSFFEYHALSRQAARDPGRVPEVYHFDETQALIIMRYLSPHLILRKSLKAGVKHPNLPQHLGLFMARTLFRGSDLHMRTRDRKADLALFAGNVELCDITENLVFSDPYFDADMNKHTTPQLDAEVARLRADRDLKVAAQQLKMAFASKAETLLHGDLHTGSVMVTAEDSRVIDPEFATYGPIGFDVGMLLANYFMAYFAQRGYEDTPGRRDDYRAWILSVAADTWTIFEQEFSALWRTERTGMLHQASLYEDQGDMLASEQALMAMLHGIWVDTLGFCGVEMHRRILGLAHIEEFESIEDREVRAAAERRALSLGRQLAVCRAQITGMPAILAMARRLEAEG